MKRLTLILAALVLIASACSQQNVFFENETQISLDPSNSYLAGDEVVFNFTNAADYIVFYSGEEGSEYAQDGTGNSIKNCQNYAYTYSYAYETPGTYTATFVTTNANYQGSDRKIIEMTITIVDNLPDYYNL